MGGLHGRCAASAGAAAARLPGGARGAALLRARPGARLARRRTRGDRITSATRPARRPAAARGPHRHRRRADRRAVGRGAASQALAALRTYASRLRKVLDPGVLVSESGGYAVRAPADGSLDVVLAQELAADAEKA